LATLILKVKETRLNNRPKYLNMEVLQNSLCSTGYRIMGNPESVRTIVCRLRTALVKHLQAWVDQGLCHDADECAKAWIECLTNRGYRLRVPKQYVTIQFVEESRRPPNGQSNRIDQPEGVSPKSQRHYRKPSKRTQAARSTHNPIVNEE
jgi:hypothetical protein